MSESILGIMADACLRVPGRWTDGVSPQFAWLLLFLVVKAYLWHSIKLISIGDEEGVDDFQFIQPTCCNLPRWLSLASLSQRGELSSRAFPVAMDHGFGNGMFMLSNMTGCKLDGSKDNLLESFEKLQRTWYDLMPTSAWIQTAALADMKGGGVAFDGGDRTEYNLGHDSAYDC